jgi:antitoxin (DNA-binding transcriptional repressor) of toxin-antitoxin stability system
MAASVGIREFRAGLAGYIASATPVAVTRHGQTIGWFIPTPATREAEIASLRAAAEALDGLLAEHRVDVDKLVEEFKSARHTRK